MAFQSAQSIINYYAGLLVLQYLGKPKAYATIQTVVTGPVMPQGSAYTLPTLPVAVLNGYNLNPTIQAFTPATTPVAGHFTLSYNGSTSALISYNATSDQLLAAVNGLFGVLWVSVAGTPATGFVLTFNIPTVPQIVTLTNNTTGVTYNYSNNLAVGVQLDVLGKYAGVSRSGFGTYGPITLDDADFAKLIQLAIITNSFGSSLSDIVGLLYQYFPGQIAVFDKSDTEPMEMQYYVSSAAFSNNLLQLFIAEGLLPHPMAVGIAVLAPLTVTTLYGWCDYATATPTQPNTVNTVGMNCASSYTLGDYNTTWAYLDYSDSLVA